MPSLPHHARQQLSAPRPDPAYCASTNELEILGITGSFTAFATLIVLLRFIVRTFMLQSVGSDDYVMLCSWLTAAGTFACFVGETKYAVGHHIECVKPWQFELSAKWQYYHSIWVMIGVVLVKISVALFLMRLAPPGKKWKSFLWAIIVFLACFCLSCLGTLIFSCIPIEASWDFAVRTKPSTHCFSNDTYSSIGLMNSSINCATDFLLAIVPIPIIIKLQINKRTKVTLGFILSLGYVACAAGIVKAVKQHGFFHEKDPFWHNGFNVWNMIELCVGIIAASLPALRPLFAKILESTKSAFSDSSWGSRDRTHLEGIGKRYHRQQCRDGVPGSPEDVRLHDWKQGSHSTSNSKTLDEIDLDKIELPAGPSRRSAGLRAPLPAPPPPSYRDTVCSGGREPGDSSSWEDIEVVRSQSQESLNRPAGQEDVLGIYKTLEITRRSELIADADRVQVGRTMGIA